MIKMKSIWISGIVLVLIAGNILVYPEDNYETHSKIVYFERLGLGKILVDDNPRFSSPFMVDGAIELDPGMYYWKTTGLSETRKFTIISEVGIEVKNKGNNREVRNVGNTNLDLKFRRWNDFGITGSAILDVGDSMEVNLNNTIVEAGEK